MLRTRRVLAFSGRIQNYLLLLYSFFFLTFLASSFFPASEQFVQVLLGIETFLGWTTIIMGVAIIVGCIFSCVADKVFPVADTILAVIRTCAVFICSLLMQLMQQTILHGIIIS